METREELLYNKEKLLSNGDRAEAEIQANLQSDHVSACRLKTRQGGADGSSTDKPIVRGAN